MQVLQDANALRFLKGFWGVRQQMVRKVAPVLVERHGVDLSDLFLMIHIAHSDLTPGEIAEEMQIPAHTISRKLDALSKAGLVERALHPQDARKRVLTLTKEGAQTLETSQATLEQEVSSLLEPLTQAGLEHLLTQLEILSNA